MTLAWGIFSIIVGAGVGFVGAFLFFRASIDEQDKAIAQEGRDIRDSNKRMASEIEAHHATFDDINEKIAGYKEGNHLADWLKRRLHPDAGKRS